MGGGEWVGIKGGGVTGGGSEMEEGGEGVEEGRWGGGVDGGGEERRGRGGTKGGRGEGRTFSLPSDQRTLNAALRMAEDVRLPQPARCSVSCSSSGPFAGRRVPVKEMRRATAATLVSPALSSLLSACFTLLCISSQLRDV